MTTGLVRSSRNGSSDNLLSKLSCEDIVPAIPRLRLLRRL